MTKKETSEKKMQFVGSRKLVDPDTGELIEAATFIDERRDFNFKKIWVGAIIERLDIIGTKRTKILFHLFDMADSQNLIVASYRDLAEATGTSLETVRVTMNALQDGNILVMVKRGVYRLNPDVVFRGKNPARMAVLTQYRKEQTPPKELSDEEKLENLEKTMKPLLEQAEALKQKIAKKAKKKVTTDQSK